MNIVNTIRLRGPAILIGALAAAALLAAGLAAALAWGGPSTPAPMRSINSPFETASRDSMPALSRYRARDGKPLAYRAYTPAAGGAAALGAVVLVHGSSASSASMHTLARAYAKAGYAAFALDVRGHGESGAESGSGSGQKGQIDYIGQLEDDIEDFMRAVLPEPPAMPATLVGFSSGGGFVLRFAGSPRQALFQSYLLLSPFLGQDSPTQRPGSGGWASVGMPRVVALTLLHRIGFTAFETLPVVRFALDEESRAWLTPEYGFRLAANFRPHSDFRADMAAAMRPCAVLAGTDDEAFITTQLQATVKSAGKDWTVRLLPGIGHIPLILDGRAVDAAVQSVRRLQSSAG